MTIRGKARKTKVTTRPKLAYGFCWLGIGLALAGNGISRLPVCRLVALRDAQSALFHATKTALHVNFAAHAALCTQLCVHNSAYAQLKLSIVLTAHFTVQSLYDVTGITVEVLFYSEGKFRKVRFCRVGWGDEETNFAARFARMGSSLNVVS